jgi:hypothetical protein
MGEKDLNPSLWKDVNEAVGEALGVSPPDPSLDRVEGAPPHGTRPARMVPLDPEEGDALGVVRQEKVEGIGVSFQMVPQPTPEQEEALEEPPPVPARYTPGPAQPLPKVEGVPYITANEARRVFLEEEYKKQEEWLARENARRLRQQMPVFHDDGSLLGEYAPMQGDAVTPDTVDGLWWLGLPEKRAIWELGISPKDYPRVHRDVSIAAAVTINRRAQTGQYIPLIIKRKKRRLNSSLFAGGAWHTIKPLNPSDFPGMSDDPHPA